MRASKFVKVAVTCGVLFLFASVLIGCVEQGYSPVKENKVGGLTGGTAATVNGVEIEEDTITTYIQSYRKTYGLTSNTSWAEWLIENDYTSESLREATINTYISQELIKEAAAEYGIEIPSSEIDAYVESVSVYYGDEEAWQRALENEGITEEEYRESIEVALLKRAVKDSIDAGEEPTDVEIFEYAQDHIHSYEGAKKSEHILFSPSDSALAEEVLKKIQAGELSFEDAAAQYSTDSENSQTGGNKGWNVLDTNMATAYSSALNELDEGEISEPITSEYGIHLIKCTDIYTPSEYLSDLSQIPEEFVRDIRTTLESNKKNDAYTTWYEGYYEAADVVINEMPENVPYIIDLSKYQEEAKADASDAESSSQGESEAGSEKEVPDPTQGQPGEIK